MSLPALTLDDRRPAPLEADLLHDIAAGIAAATTLWQPLVHHDPDQRRPVRLLATDVYEVWVIGWLPGQRAELHDHGDSAGVIHVIDGTLTEHVVTDGAIHARELPAGSVEDLEVGLVHEVVNSHDGPATSIHVYSPPLETMTRYDGTSLQATFTELLYVEDPAFGASPESVLRHPSLRG
jgi:predicted metal-dependent enzyme (double-stranded beta helix superfamily)